MNSNDGRYIPNWHWRLKMKSIQDWIKTFLRKLYIQLNLLSAKIIYSFFSYLSYKQVSLKVPVVFLRKKKKLFYSKGKAFLYLNSFYFFFSDLEKRRRRSLGGTSVWYLLSALSRNEHCYDVRTQTVCRNSQKNLKFHSARKISPSSLQAKVKNNVSFLLS